MKSVEVSTLNTQHYRYKIGGDYEWLKLNKLDVIKSILKRFV